MKGNIFLTGGTGFLGRAILAHAESVTVFSRRESAQIAVRQRFPLHRYIIGDVRDYDSVERAMVGHDIVIHAAAVKDIPTAELYPSECGAINYQGAVNITRAACRVGIKRVVGLSTDKACQPVNAYGASKLMMEKLFQEACGWGKTQFNLVRYGNIVGSTGSVIGLWQKQAQEGKLTITNPNMTRFWMSIDDAVETIIMALEEDIPGAVIIPRMGAMQLGQLASVLGNGAKVEIIGMRSGEKMHEMLLSRFESHHAQDCGEYFKLLPSTSHIGGYPWNGEYTSDKPDHWIEPEEMAEMITKGEGI